MLGVDPNCFVLWNINFAKKFYILSLDIFSIFRSLVFTAKGLHFCAV